LFGDGGLYILALLITGGHLMSTFAVNQSWIEVAACAYSVRLTVTGWRVVNGTT
jgi:hypothetical protein